MIWLILFSFLVLGWYALSGMIFEYYSIDVSEHLKHVGRQFAFLVWWICFWIGIVKIGFLFFGKKG